MCFHFNFHWQTEGEDRALELGPCAVKDGRRGTPVAGKIVFVQLGRLMSSFIILKDQSFSLGRLLKCITLETEERAGPHRERDLGE